MEATLGKARALHHQSPGCWRDGGMKVARAVKILLRRDSCVGLQLLVLPVSGSDPTVFFR